MAKRPRAHRLETESELAFQQAIPSRWVYRRKDKDYGIDGEVEIFDEGGQATGNLFLVQLKATDSQDLRQAMRVWLRMETGRYYSSLDLPMLIVRYHAPTQALYTRWFHSLDLYYGRKTGKGVTFYFDAENRWSASTAAAIEQSVVAYRNTVQPSPRLPIEIRVQIDNEIVHGVPRAELITRLAAAARAVRYIIRLEFPATVSVDDPNRVQVTADRIAVFIGHRPALTIHTEQGIPEATARDSMASDVLMAVGLGLDWLGHPAIGADILIALNATSHLTRYALTAFAIARCLKRARRPAETLQIARRLILDEGELDVGHLYLLPVLLDFVPETGNRAATISFVAEIADELAKRGHSKQAAALQYSCGNALRGAHDLRGALRCYRLARKLDPAYGRRHYFEAELAGILFLLGRYQLAAEHYGRAVEVRSDRETQLRYADALLFSGHYREALNLFVRALGESPDVEDAEWILKEHALTRMLSGGVPDMQSRRWVVPPDLVDPSALTPDEIVHACEQALNEDALSGWAWFNLGSTLYRREERAQARDCYLIAALVSPGDIEAWSNAVGLSLNLGDQENAILIMLTAYRLNEEDFVLHMLERMPAPSRESFTRAMNEMNALLARSRKSPPVMRVHQPEGAWTEIPIGREG